DQPIPSKIDSDPHGVPAESEASPSETLKQPIKDSMLAADKDNTDLPARKAPQNSDSCEQPVTDVPLDDDKHSTDAQMTGKQLHDTKNLPSANEELSTSDHDGHITQASNPDFKPGDVAQEIQGELDKPSQMPPNSDPVFDQKSEQQQIQPEPVSVLSKDKLERQEHSAVEVQQAALQNKRLPKTEQPKRTKEESYPIEERPQDIHEHIKRIYPKHPITSVRVRFFILNECFEKFDASRDKVVLQFSDCPELGKSLLDRRLSKQALEILHSCSNQLEQLLQSLRDTPGEIAYGNVEYIEGCQDALETVGMYLESNCFESHEFIEWVRSNMQSADLNTFIDISMIYLGDSGDSDKKKIEMFVRVVYDFDDIIYKLGVKEGGPEGSVTNENQAVHRVLYTCFDTVDRELSDLLQYIHPDFTAELFNQTVENTVLEKAKRTHSNKDDQEGNKHDQVCAALEDEGYNEDILFRTAYKRLPQFEDVLLCHDGTSEEELAVFLHRALLDPSGDSVYTILNAEQLTYKISVVAEEMFSKLIDSVDGTVNSRFFVFVSSANQSQFPFCNYLRPYEQDFPMEPDAEKIKKFSQKTLQKAEPKNSDFLWITSSRSGMGKSLVCEHFAWSKEESVPAVFACNTDHLCVDELLTAAEQYFPGFRKFVVDCLLLMSKDFSTRSLDIDDESERRHDDGRSQPICEIESFQLKRHWEQESHPLLLFNQDSDSFTFIGFKIDANGNLVDLNTGKILKKGIMSKQLRQSLLNQGVPLDDDFEELEQCEKIIRIRNVFGFNDSNENLETLPEFDSSYELTMDNVKKILAIYMRFRCKIPVVIMGETGCGKTKLVDFLAKIMRPLRNDIDNIRILKVHGGITAGDIEQAVSEAEVLAEKNFSVLGNKSPYTVLFFDEINTTSYVGLIKEIMMDGRIKGRRIDFEHGLRCVAACNPYRKHSEETIKRLESSGLGYRVRKEETVDKFGNIPMRCLVYRVKPLPLSLISVLWDFGNLSEDAERKYVVRMIDTGLNGLSEVHRNRLTNAVCESQKFMRNATDETKFVSLRDVERCSPWSTSDGIEKLFQQSAKMQIEKSDPENYVSVVVLDEIGLAEDTPQMSLKVLHSLLEDGVRMDSDGGPSLPGLGHERVGFIGISNWALDPAKMNRGLFVLRDVPTKTDLLKTAKGICKDTIVQANFRIIVIADGKTVQDLFPIPLLNRLEKHRLTWRTILEPDMLGFCEKFKEWMNRFLSQEEKGDSALSWSFVGYHDDVIPSLAIDENCDFDSVKRRVLSTATPDSLIRLASTSLRDEKAGILNSYYEENGLGCLASFLNNYKLKKPFLQVTTYDSILGANQQATLSQMPIFKGATYKNISQFETELQFKEFLRKCMTSEGLLILQYEGLQQNQNFQKVVSSVKFNIEEMYLAEKRNMEPTESTWRLLRRKTAPALASFIAFADTDENLANYQREETRALWLKLAPHAAMFDETIENFVKVGPVEQARVEVPSSAADGHHFASQFPFSWAIVKRLEKFEEQSNAGNLSIRDSPMGQALAEEKSSDFLLEAFCHDILHICVSSITSSDVVALQAVLQETVKSVLKEQRKEQTLADTILQAFKSLKKHIEQVNIFVKLTQRIGDLAKNLKKVENFQDLPSELFNAFAKHFEKSRHELNKAQKRKEWLSRVDKSRTIIVRLLAELENPQMQLQWDKINCVALFLRNVTMPFDNEELNESTIKPIRLWNSLWSSAAVKFQDKTGIEEIEKFLEKNREELLEFSMGTDTCSQCTNRTDSLTRLPCNDRLCDQCRDKCIQSAPFVCIKCQTPFDPNTINNEKPDVLVKFKDRCNSFVMEVVSTLCFVEGQPPDSELCNHLLSYVTRSGGDGNVMGYFSNDKDESPMFRSFVLQQLMRYNSDQVVQRLEEHILGADEKAMAEWRVDLLRLACRLAELATEGTVRNLLSTDDATILIRTLSEHRWSRIYFLRCLCMAGGTCATLQRIQTDPCLAEAYNNELHQMDNGTPEDGNEQYTAGDRTSKGFVSTGIPEPVRNLPSCGVALMRMMMGLALQLGNDSNSETGSRKHFKDVGREEFEVGLHLFCDATGRSSEDAFHALHLVLKRLATAAALLPHRKPWGRCIVGLIQLLVDAHNAVIDACENSEPDTVKIGLIDEASLQQQLRERLVRGRPRICGYLPEMVYNEDFNLMEIFKQLDRFGVKQCNLPTPILTALLDDSLKVVINFLISLTPSNPSQLLDDFMQNTLHMDSGLPTDALKRQVTIAHTRLLWMSLDHLRWKQLAQDGFEPYDTEQAEPLSQEQLQELPPGLKNKRSLLLEMLHRLIRLELRSLPTSLQEHPLNQMADFDAVYEVAFQDLPSSLEGKHACSLWSVVFAWANE
uniref:AAA domain-containing protein n=1 Tax=Macrostomum lignano TaxID=282301 RepID=A0A1I8JAH1_9PLAT